MDCISSSPYQPISQDFHELLYAQKLIKAPFRDRFLRFYGFRSQPPALSAKYDFN